MLLKLSDKISECLAHAADARELANAAIDLGHKADHLDMERRWLRLVESYRFVEQAHLFLQDANARWLPAAETLPQTGVLVVICPTTGRKFSTGILTDTDSLALLPQELIRSRCPHCDDAHAWETKDARLVAALPLNQWVEFARSEVIMPIGELTSIARRFYTLARKTSDPIMKERLTILADGYLEQADELKRQPMVIQTAYWTSDTRPCGARIKVAP